MKFVLFAILIYLLYQFIFNLLIPVYRTARKIKKGFREMHERMNQQFQQQQDNSSSASTNATRSQTAASDYIDFEEIK